MLLRAATAADLPAITAIYAQAVREGTASFELVPPGLEEMARRMAAIAEQGYPYLAAEIDGAFAGYAYANAFRPRAAYRHTVEDSIYVAPGFHGRGIGRALLDALIDACERRGYRQMVAVIGDSANEGSIALHRACGFTHMGTLAATGLKFGRWVDTVLMQRPLGPGASDIPGM